MLACSYDRVSTGRQAAKTDLNTRYQKAIQAHCERHGWPLRRRFTDPGMSGKNAARPGMQKAIQWAIKHKGVIVFYDLSRFSRSLMDLVSIAEELRKHGAALSSCTESIDLRDDNPAAELQFHILAACAQFMRRLTSKKVKERNARTVEERGHRTNGTQRAGWRLVDGRLVECPEEQAVLAIIRDLEDEYLEPVHIAAALNARRVPTIRRMRGYKHAGRWTEGTVRGIQESMARPLLCQA